MATETNAMTNATANISHWKDKLFDYSIEHAGGLIAAAIVVVVGFIAARSIGRLLDRWLTRRNMEQPMRTLLVRVLRLFIFAMALIVALSTAGMNVTALIAGFGVAGIGVGLAMQGVLSNLVAGLSIIFTKPFRVGEYIALLGVQGQVKTVELFSTTLTHPDLSHIVIPNRKIVGEILHNYGHIRQLELSVGVGYGTDLSNVTAIVRAVLSKNSRVLKEPVPGVGVALLADSSINIAIKPWTKVEDFNAATTEINQAIVEAFRANKIEIPFPQREVRMLNN